MVDPVAEELEVNTNQAKKDAILSLKQYVDARKEWLSRLSFNDDAISSLNNLYNRFNQTIDLLENTEVADTERFVKAYETIMFYATHLSSRYEFGNLTDDEIEAGMASSYTPHGHGDLLDDIDAYIQGNKDMTGYYVLNDNLRNKFSKYLVEINQNIDRFKAALRGKGVPQAISNIEEPVQVGVSSVDEAEAEHFKNIKSQAVNDLTDVFQKDPEKLSVLFGENHQETTNNILAIKDPAHFAKVFSYLYQVSYMPIGKIPVIAPNVKYAIDSIDSVGFNDLQKLIEKNQDTISGYEDVQKKIKAVCDDLGVEIPIHVPQQSSQQVLADYLEEPNNDISVGPESDNVLEDNNHYADALGPEGDDTEINIFGSDEDFKINVIDSGDYKLRIYYSMDRYNDLRCHEILDNNDRIIQQVVRNDPNDKWVGDSIQLSADGKSLVHSDWDADNDQYYGINSSVISSVGGPRDVLDGKSYHVSRAKQYDGIHFAFEYHDEQGRMAYREDVLPNGKAILQEPLNEIGEVHGIRKVWRISGNLQQEAEYKHDLQDGRLTLYQNKTDYSSVTTGNAVLDKYDGEVTETLNWDDDTTFITKSNYVEGVIHGKSRSFKYNKNGKLVSKELEIYENDDLKYASKQKNHIWHQFSHHMDEMTHDRRLKNDREANYRFYNLKRERIYGENLNGYESNVKLNLGVINQRKTILHNSLADETHISKLNSYKIGFLNVQHGRSYMKDELGSSQGNSYGKSFGMNLLAGFYAHAGSTVMGGNNEYKMRNNKFNIGLGAVRAEWGRARVDGKVAGHKVKFSTLFNGISYSQEQANGIKKSDFSIKIFNRTLYSRTKYSQRENGSSKPTKSFAKTAGVFAPFAGSTFKYNFDGRENEYRIGRLHYSRKVDGKVIDSGANKKIMNSDGVLLRNSAQETITKNLGIISADVFQKNFMNTVSDHRDIYGLKEENYTPNSGFFTRDYNAQTRRDAVIAFEQNVSMMKFNNIREDMENDQTSYTYNSNAAPKTFIKEKEPVIKEKEPVLIRLIKRMGVS